MRKILGILMVALMIVALSNMALGEVFITGSNKVIYDTGASLSNQTRNSMTITLDDTSLDGSAKVIDTNVTIEIYHEVNDTVGNHTLNVCLFKSQQTKNSYNTDGTLNHSETEVQTVIYNYTSTSLRYYFLREKDILQIDLDCFWDSEIDDTIFGEVPLATMGLASDTNAYACGTCARQDYEEIVTAYIDAGKTTDDYLRVYDGFTEFSGLMMTLWFIVYWVVRIALYIVLVMLSFLGMFWLYNWFVSLSKEI